MKSLISAIRNGVPWTKDDESLLTDLPEEDQEVVLNWIKDNILPRKKPLEGRSSYGIKHILQHDTKIYTTNNQFKHAMLLCGYEPVDENKLNWNYRISKESPAFDYDSRSLIF